MPQPHTRRNLLITGAAVAAAASAARTIGANERINVGMIGVGAKGGQHLHFLDARADEKKDVRVAAVIDIYTTRKERAREQAGLESKHVHHDYRDLLARPDIDAVFISTPDHWHARMALDALTAGKDVYLEKPMTYTIDEAQAIAREVQSSGRVLQIGSQHLSDLRYHRARDVIEKGRIGKPLWAQASSSRNSVHGEWNYRIDAEGTPANIDWKAFVGPARKRPFSAERYFRWRKYWDYSGGIATDLLYHRLGPLLLALGSRFPVRVSGHGGIYVHQDREVPDTYATTIEYDDFQILFGSSMASSVCGRHMPAAIFGHEAALRFEGGGIRLVPEPKFAKKFQDTTGHSEVFIEVEQEDIKLKHHDDFLKAVRSRKQPVFDALHGHRVMTAIRLGVDSYRTGRTMLFDPKSEKVIRTAPPRPGYEGTGENHDEPRVPRRRGA